jgi:nitroreductase
MTRAFDPSRPVPPELITHLVDLAARAPSAGKTQGWHLVVLEGAQTDQFWELSLPAQRRGDFAWPGLLDAPVIALALADPQAYLDRYSEPDKAGTGWGRSVEAWSAPYWTIDASMAIMTLLLAAQDAGLGSLLFAVSHQAAAIRTRLGIPERLELLGALALGWPLEPATSRLGRSSGRPRRDPEAIIHRGAW